MVIDSLNVSCIRDFCDPYSSVIWKGLDAPISYEEIETCLKEGRFFNPSDKNAFYENVLLERDVHIGKISYFVKNGWSDPILLDIQPDYLGEYWPVLDGNHRLMAAMFRGDDVIEGIVLGEQSFFPELIQSSSLKM